jgi:uncharacterized cupredoxin-like copper-binding protein
MTHTYTRRAVLAVASLATAFTLSSCGSDPTDTASDGEDSTTISNKITGNVSEWKVQVSSHTAEAGEVTFAIANFGTIEHEFLVTKTSFEPGMIPIGADNRFDEELEGISVVNEIPEWKVNDAKVLTVNLDPGTYELLCNIEGHYKNGMHTTLTVVPGTGGPTQTTTPASEKVSNDVTGVVQEWEVEVDAHNALAGNVSFTMTNDGTIQHEFLVVKTDIPDGEIPLGTNNRFDEKLEGISVVDEIPEWAAGETKTLSLDLTPGNYQLLCNIEGHYKNGMHTTFTVK